MSSTFPATLLPEELADIKSHSPEVRNNTEYKKSFEKWDLPLTPLPEDRKATVRFILNGASGRDKQKDRVAWLRSFIGRWVFLGGAFGRGKAKIVIPYTTQELLRAARKTREMTTKDLMFVVHHRHMKFIIRGADYYF